MAITKEDVLKALGYVQDPDLHQDLVTLKMIKDVEIDGNKVAFTVVLTTPACPLKEKIKNDWKSFSSPVRKSVRSILNQVERQILLGISQLVRMFSCYREVVKESKKLR